MEQVDEEVVRIEVDFRRIDGVHLGEQHHGGRARDQVEESCGHVGQRLIFKTFHESRSPCARFDGQRVL